MTTEALITATAGDVLELSESQIVAALEDIPEEEIWLAQYAYQTRRAYRVNVAEFVRFLGIRSLDL